MSSNSVRTLLFDLDSFFARRKSSLGLVFPVLVVASASRLDVARPLLTFVILDANDPTTLLPTVVAGGFPVGHSALLLIVVAVALDPSTLGSPNTRTTMDMVTRGAFWSLLLRFVGLLFTVWGAYIWVVGVQHVRSAIRKQVIVSVGIPVARFTISSSVGVAILP